MTRDLLYSCVALNLYVFVVYFVCSLSCLTFHRVKSNKNARHRQNKAQQPFARAVLASTRSADACHSLLLVQASGAKELAFHAPTATRKTPLKHHLPFIRCSNGCSLLFRRCRFYLNITFACINPRLFFLGEHIGSPLQLFRVYGFVFRALYCPTCEMDNITCCGFSSAEVMF